MMRWLLCLCACLNACAAAPALANLPLTVDDLFTAHQRFRLVSGLEYSNRELSEPLSGFVRNSDVAVASLGLRYGLSRRLEVFGRVYGYYSQTRTQSSLGLQTDASSDWNRIVAGANFQFSPDNKTPALLGFAAVDLLENPPDPGLSLRYGKSASVGLTTFRSIDPLLLSAILRLDYRASYQHAGVRIEPGHGLVFSPQTAFAINHLVTLTGGLRWEWRQGTQLQGRQLALDRTGTSILLGLGYSWSEATTVSFDTEFSVTDNDGASISLNMVYKFDDTGMLRKKLQE